MRRLGHLLRRFEWATNGIFPPVITVLVGLNVLAFLLDALTGGWVTYWFALSWNTLAQGQVWRVLTAGFVHADFRHILFNLLFYCFFAHTVHRHLGPGRFLQLILTAIVFGNLAQVCWSGLGPERMVAGWILGFSGAFLATIVAFATIAPQATTVFIIVQIPAWLLATILVLLDVSGFFSGGRGTAYLAHLGGAAIGFLFIRFPRVFAWGRWFRRFSDRYTAAVEQRRTARTAAQEAKLDELLAKVSEHGLPSLTEAERRFLTTYSTKKHDD